MKTNIPVSTPHFFLIGHLRIVFLFLLYGITTHSLQGQTGRCLLPHQFISDGAFQDSCSGNSRFFSDLNRCDTTQAQSGYYFLADSAVNVYWQGGVWTGTDHSVGGQSRVLFASVYPGNQWVQLWSQTVIPDSAGEYEFSFYSLFPNQNIQHIPTQLIVVLQIGTNTPDTQMIQVNPIAGAWQFQVSDFNLLTNDSTTLSIYTQQDTALDLYFGIDDVSFRRINSNFNNPQIVLFDTISAPGYILLGASPGFSSYEWFNNVDSSYYTTDTVLQVVNSINLNYFYVVATDQDGCSGTSDVEALVNIINVPRCGNDCYVPIPILHETFPNHEACSSQASFSFGSGHTFCGQNINGPNCTAYNHTQLLNPPIPGGLFYVVNNAGNVRNIWNRVDASTPSDALLVGDPWNSAATQTWYVDVNLVQDSFYCLSALVSNVLEFQETGFLPVASIRVSDDALNNFPWPNSFVTLGPALSIRYSQGWRPLQGSFQATTSGIHRIAIVNNATINSNTNGSGRDLGVDEIRLSRLDYQPPSGSISGNQTICTGSPALLTITLGGNPGPWHFSYSNGSTNIVITGITSSPYILSVTPTQNTTYTLNYVTVGNCTTQTASNAIVTLLPVANASWSANQTICVGNSASQSIHLTGTGPWDFSYSDGTNTTIVTGISVSPYVFTVTPSSTTTYTLNYVVMNGCTTQVNQNSIITVIPYPTGSISAPQPICLGVNTQLSVNLTGTGPWEISYSDGVSSIVVTGITSSPYLINVTPTLNTTYTLNYVVTSGCTTQVGTNVILNPINVDVSIPGSSTICEGVSTLITYHLTGNGPWDLEYSDGTSNFQVTGITSSPYTFSVTPAQTTTYMLNYVVLGSCTTQVNQSFVVTVVPVPSGSFSANQTICSGSSAQLTFTLNGGGYSYIQYTDGTNTYGLGGNSPILINVSPTTTTTYRVYSIGVNGCNTAVDLVAVVTVIAADANISGTQTICAGSAANLSINLGTGSNGPWDVSYSDGTNNVVVTGITASPYLFTVTPGQTLTYTLNTVITAGCTTQVSSSAIVSIYYLGATITPPNQIICEGHSTSLQINLFGVGPWDITYSDGTNTTQVTGISVSPYFHSITPVHSTTYTLTSVSTDVCTAFVQLNNASIVNVVPVPTVVISSNQTICIGQTATLTFQVSGTGLWDFTYNDGSAATTISGISSNLYLLSVSPTITTTYSVTSVNQVCQNPISNQSAVITVMPLPTVQVLSSQTICQGSAPRITLTLTGTPLWSFSYSDGTTTIPVSGISFSPYFFNVSPPQSTTYIITGLTDQYCTNPNNPSFVVHVVPTPGVSISATQTLCSGSTGQVIMNLTGLPNWQVDYSDGTNNLTQTGNSSPFIIPVTPSVSTTYSIIRVISEPCTVSVSSEASIKVYPIPIVRISSDQSICHGDGTVLTVQQSAGATPWSFSWTDGTTTNTVTGMSNNPYLISVTPLVTTTYTVNSISDPFCSDSVSQQVVITVIPRPSISVHANIHNVCPGDIFATPIYFSGPPAPWTLVYTDGSSAPVSLIITASPYMFPITATGNMFYTLTPFYNGCQGLGDYFNINVPSIPRIAISNDQTICVGNVANISLSLLGTQPWSIEYSEGTNPIHQYIQTSSSPYVYSVTPAATTSWFFHSISDANNCATVYSPPKQVVVTVIPGPTPDLGPDQTICLDPANPSSVILEDPALPISYAYLWSTGQHSNSIQVFPLVTTSYSLQVTDGFGCVGSDIITIFVAPLPTISMSHSLDCTSGCYDYTAIASSPMFNTFTYVWSLDDAGMNNVQIPGTSTGTSDVIVHWCLGGQNYYSAHVYARDPLGCTGYNMMVVPHIDPNKMVGGDMLICPVPNAAQPVFLGSEILSALDPLYTFSWTGPNGFTSNQANPILTLSGGEEGVYSLTLTSPENCVFYNEVYLDVCCLQPTAGIPEATYILSPGDVLSSTTLSSATVWIRGTIDIDGRSQLDACDVRMKQGAEIRIPATTQPNPSLPGYNQLIIDDSHIHADCSIMWSTIRVLDDINYNDEPGGLVVINNSLIEDAHTAVSSISGGNFFIQNSTLNANNIHLHLHGWGGHVNQKHRSMLDEATLSCSRPLIAPYAGRRTEIGISIANMNPADRMSVDFGWFGNAYNNQYNLSATRRNRIINSDQGISVHQTDLSLYQFDFKDISCPHSFLNSCLIPPFNERPTALRIQGNGTWHWVFGCTFDNIWHGIVTAASGRSVFYSNQLTDVTEQGISVLDAMGGSLQLLEFNTIQNRGSGTGAWVTRSGPFTDIRITGNTIRNNKAAILTENNSTSFLNIGGNDIFNPGPINFPSSGFNVGIWVNEPNLSTSFIGRNTITSRFYGIHTFGGPVVNERIWKNRVELVRNLDGSGFNAPNYGIAVRDRNTPILISNYVKGIGIPTQFSSSSRVRGITLENNDNPFAHCNEMDNTFTGMIAMGDNTTADLQRNSMWPARVGFLFKDNGQVGAQGSLIQTNDNEWHCQFTISALRAENSLFANLSPFYVQSGSAPFDPVICGPNFVSSNTIITFPGNGNPAWPWVDAALSNSDPSPVVCDPFYWLRTAESDSSSENNEREVFDPVSGPDTFANDITAWYYLVATDSLNFERYPEYLRLASRLNLYRNLTRMDSLRDIDSLFHAFYTIAHSSSERFISNLLDATGNHEVEDGRNILSSWTPSNSTEEIWWNWFEISFRLMENASDTLRSGLKDSIIDYARMCPDALGYPVHAARTVLMRIGLDSMVSINECENWTYSDEVDSLNTDSWDSGNSMLLIYPNPATITVNFEHDLDNTENTRIKVYDAMGNIKYDEIFFETSRTLTWDTSSEISGLYYVVLIQNETVMESKSLAIIH